MEDLSEIFLNHQRDKAHNINLVSGAIYADKITKALKIAKEKGLNIPVIYNSNGYERLDTLKKLEGLIDVYLPDLKYVSNEMGLKYSKVDNYFETATKAIKEMERQVGKPQFDENGMIKKGLIVRHLIMPNHIENTKNILKWFKENMNSHTYISVMAQYFPSYKANEYEEINRKITKEEYKQIEDYINYLGIENGYMQDPPEENEEQYVPKWEY